MDQKAYVQGLKAIVTQIFQNFDADKDGRLDSYEFGVMLTALSELVTGSRTSPRQVDDLITLCDTDNDDCISKDEFLLFRDVIIAQIQDLMKSKPKEARNLIEELHYFSLQI